MGKRRIYTLFALVCAIFGTTFLAIKVGLASGASPLLLAALRFIAAGLLLGVMLALLGRASPRACRSLLPRAALLSLFYIVANFGATFWAMQYLGSGTAAQIDTTGPIITAALTGLLLGKRLTRQHALGLILGIVGAYLIIGAPSGSAGGRGLLAGLVMLAATFFFSLGSVIYHRLFSEEVDALLVSALNMLTGGIILLGLSLIFETPRLPCSAACLLPLLYLVLVGSVVAHSANLYLIKEAGPLFASSWLYVSPVIATAAGALFLGERVRAASLAGAAATLLGVYLIARAESMGGRSARSR